MIEHPGDRTKALREAEVIVTTGGMLDGGPVLYYIGELYRDANSSIFLTGFQVEGSNGRQLLDEGTLTIDETTIRPVVRGQKFDFSAHAGHSELVKFAQATRARDGRADARRPAGAAPGGPRTDGERGPAEQRSLDLPLGPRRASAGPLSLTGVGVLDGRGAERTLRAPRASRPAPPAWAGARPSAAPGPGSSEGAP